MSRSKYITKRLLDDEYYIAYVDGYKNGRIGEIYSFINDLNYDKMV